MELFDYWNQSGPPTCELVAAYLGFKPREHSDPLNDTEQQILMSMGDARPFSSLPKDVQDAFAQIKAGKRPN